MRFPERFLIGVLVILSGAAVQGQGTAEKKAPQEKKHVESRRLLEDILIARLTSELALDDAQTVLLVRHLSEHRERLIALRRERAETMRALRQAVREGNDEQKLRGLLDDVLALQERGIRERNAILDFDGFEMTAWQRARLLLFLNDFESDMKRLLRRAQARKEAAKSRARGDNPRTQPPNDSTPEGADETPGDEADR